MDYSWKLTWNVIGRYYLMYKEKNVLDKGTIYRTILDMSFIYAREFNHFIIVIYVYELGIWEDNIVIIWRKKILYY